MIGGEKINVCTYVHKEVIVAFMQLSTYLHMYSMHVCTYKNKTRFFQHRSKESVFEQIVNGTCNNFKNAGDIFGQSYDFKSIFALTFGHFYGDFN
jgi:hypothetical protein